MTTFVATFNWYKMTYKNIKITGTGSYIPTEVVTNEDFAQNEFLDLEGNPFDATHEEISEKFKAITGIEERRYVTDNLNTSDIGTLAARQAIEDAGVSSEEIDHIIVATNFGNVKKRNLPIGFSSKHCFPDQARIENPKSPLHCIRCYIWLPGLGAGDNPGGILYPKRDRKKMPCCGCRNFVKGARSTRSGFHDLFGWCRCLRGGRSGR